MIGAVIALVVLVLAHRLHPRLDPRRRVAGRRRPRTAGAGRLARWGAGAVAAFRYRQERRAGLDPAVVAEWCGDLSRSIRSGATLRFAIEHAQPATSGLRHATDGLRLGLARGRPIADAADAELTGTLAVGRRGADHLALACSVIAVCGRLGGSAAPALDRVASTLRQRAADGQERSAQAAQARLSAHVLTALPIAVLALLLIVDDGVRRALASPAGLGCVLAGAVLNVGGWLWMRRIIRPSGGVRR